MRLKVLKQQLSSPSHPIRMLLTEFTKAFLYINRHLLYTEKEDEDEEEDKYGFTQKELKKSLNSAKRQNHLSESHREEAREMLIAEPEIRD